MLAFGTGVKGSSNSSEAASTSDSSNSQALRQVCLNLLAANPHDRTLLERLVLDEAARMLDMGFTPDAAGGEAGARGAAKQHLSADQELPRLLPPKLVSKDVGLTVTEL